jgi:GT2 family glycosyltransferase
VSDSPDKQHNAGRVAILTVCYNQWAYTRAFLESVQCLEDTNYQIIVVDNASADETVAEIRRGFPAVTLLPLQENTGYSGGNNAGITYALEQGFGSVLIVNNDTTLAPDALTKMRAHLRPNTIVTPQVRPASDPTSESDVTRGFDAVRGVMTTGRNPSSGKEMEMVTGTCMLVASDVFERVGMFDEEFFLYYEDIDFGLRCVQAGVRIVNEPAAIVIHHERASSGFGWSPLCVYYCTRNRLYIMKKHGYRQAPFLAYFYTTRQLRLISYLLAGKFKLARAIMAGVRDYHRGRLHKAVQQW